MFNFNIAQISTCIYDQMRFATSTIYAITSVPIVYNIASTLTNQPLLFTFTILYYHYLS